MIIASYEYKIGTANGEYPAGTKIIDSLIGLSDVTGMIVAGQAYNTGLIQIGNTLEFGNVYASNNGDVITVIFGNAINISA